MLDNDAVEADNTIDQDSYLTTHSASRYLNERSRVISKNKPLSLTADSIRERLADTDADTLIHHSDRGSQYVSVAYTDRLNDAGVKPSVGTVGDSYDNALVETISGLYKTEFVHNLGPWKSTQTLEVATLNWVHWYNYERLMGTIGYVPPAEYENLYCLSEPQLSKTA